MATMSNVPDQSTAHAGETSLTASTLIGSFWMSTQWILNKLVATVAALLIAHFLSPREYGLATMALAIAGFLCIMSPLEMGDVLIAYSRYFDRLAPTARRLVLGVASISTSVTLLAIPVVLWAYDAYPAVWLGGLLAVLAIRPLFEAVLLVPMSNLRHRLEFRRIAMIDGLVQLAATLFSVGLAAGGGRASSLILPQLLNGAVRALCYGRIGAVRSARHFHRRGARLLMVAYLEGAGAQYIHGVVVNMEILVLGYLAGSYHTGLLGLAFTLAVQMNRTITAWFGTVLQPILGRLQRDPAQQLQGFYRAHRVLGAVCVPLGLLQIVLAEPLFRLVLDPKWKPAIPVFQALSLMQAFHTTAGLSMLCLKAQRRFKVLLIWQGAQFMLSLPAYWFGALQGEAVGVAMTSALMWFLSALTAVWLCVCVEKGWQWRQVMEMFVRPWLVGLPVFGLGYVLVQWLSGWGTLGDVVAITVAAPGLFIIVLCITWFTDREFQSVADHVWQMSWRAVGRMAVR